MSNDTHLKILMVATETAPFAKEGGVGDVMGSLPKELAALGHEVRVVLPRYGSIDMARWGILPTGVVRTLLMASYDQTVSIYRATLPNSDVIVYFLDNAWYFGQHQRLYLGLDQRDEQRRFLLFCRGILDTLPALQFDPDIIHLNDWQTAPCAAYLRTNYAHLLRRGATRIVYTIHNLQYQGRWDPSILDEAGLDRARVFTANGLEFWGDVNWMKAGIIYADAITTVSQRYAQEIQTLQYGWGLDEMLFQRHSRVIGIPNGIDWDAWNPATDNTIAVQYTTKDALHAKARNRSALREEFDLPDDPTQPLVGIVSRLVDQKGFDLIAGCATELGKLPLQLVVLGTGHPQYEQLFRDLSASTINVRARIGFDNALAHRIYAGADYFLMPSAFEPGGLGQLIAMRYGALPIVHATGGLADTVRDIDTHPGTGTGISFEEYTTPALLNALHRAIRLYENQADWSMLPPHVMGYDSRWSASANKYSDLYRSVLRLPSG
jgi:starch synthase